MAFNVVLFSLSSCFILSFAQLQTVESSYDVPFADVFIPAQNISESTFITSENCTIAFDNFSKAVLNFTKCYIKNARPIHVCMNCGNKYKVIVEAYQYLKNQSKECQTKFFSSDQLSIVDIVYKNGNDLWLKGYCQNCYDHYNETKTFFHASNDLVVCLETTNSTSNVAPNSTCINCHDAYANLSASYNKFVLWKKEFVGGICMDIVDTMNTSRNSWSRYGCAVDFDRTVGFPNIFTTLIVGATPVMFYLLARNISRLEDVKIVRPKRKITVYVPTPPIEE